MNKTPATLLAALGLIASACSQADPPMPSRLVVEGWINSEGTPVVILSTSLDPRNGDTDLADHMVRWAKVTVSDGISTTILTGGPSTKYFPPFRYYSSDMFGCPGRQYTLTAEYNGMRVTACSTMPQPTPIDSVTIAPVAGCDTIRSVMLHFTAPRDCPAFYYMTICEATGDELSRPFPVMLSPTEVTEPGSHVRLAVYQPKVATDSAEYEPNLIVGRNYVVNLCRIDRPVFEFQRSYDNLILFGTNQFLADQGDLSTNISGGFGIWAAQASTSVPLSVK